MAYDLADIARTLRLGGDIGHETLKAAFLQAEQERDEAIASAGAWAGQCMERLQQLTACEEALSAAEQQRQRDVEQARRVGYDEGYGQCMKEWQVSR